MEISKRSQLELQHIFNLIGRRIVPCYFFTHNREEYLKWQFNACRQTGLICAYFLDQLAQNINRCHNTNFNAQLYDGYFSDVYHKEYNHAWAFMSKGDDYAKGFLVDVARVTYPNIVVWDTFNDPEQIYRSRILTSYDGAGGAGIDFRLHKQERLA